MPTLSDFDMTQKWPAKDPKVIQLYSCPTPNGVKVSILLDETGLAYLDRFLDRPAVQKGLTIPAREG